MKEQKMTFKEAFLNYESAIINLLEMYFTDEVVILEETPDDYDYDQKSFPIGKKDVRKTAMKTLFFIIEELVEYGSDQSCKYWLDAVINNL